MTIWQPATDKLWEFWQARKDAQGNWHAGYGGAMQNVSQSPGYYTSDSWPGRRSPTVGGDGERPAGDRGNDPAGRACPRAHRPRPGDGHPVGARRGLLLARPAHRRPLDSPDAIPEGARFRLDPDLDIAALNLPPLVRMIAEAAQRYGMVVRDQTGPGGAIGFFVEDTSLLGAADPFWAPDGRPRRRLLSGHLAQH